jgi:hypothetical protein
VEEMYCGEVVYDRMMRVLYWLTDIIPTHLLIRGMVWSVIVMLVGWYALAR